MLDEELAAALGSPRHERTVARRGYRHRAITRTVTTVEGTRRLEVPRRPREERAGDPGVSKRGAAAVCAADDAVPRATWKSLRTTNALGNLNREFRAGPKRKPPFGTEAAAITLLYGLVAFGQIVLRRLDGHEQLPVLSAKEWSQPASAGVKCDG